ncbi:MAG: TIGR03936 family radical SAM-associated protein [Cyanobacteriota bacterium]|nr:TIGR03936 family radical SAM-associated protein [Cyanobacteriota bacterium]MDY6359097.1 TIGR03936 family radical SAM-associated protein [Cyanobacteriota bacterium]MDY6364848.1 TIGR03936 family radical SAM-associated protein [Cyanobacteriota bacterium]MDY6383236.1 TIGR03936 family radical SAM-associated protein [Cyanobacteriota bacterium]
MCFFRKYDRDLHKCFKPYRYVGGEFLSHNKSFDDAKVRFVMAFPDKYEIGISNLGVRILYEIINRQQDYMCDRVYAPEKDFNPKPLYGLESKRALKDFDAIGFSLQYEMAYTTVLKMLEMGGIPYKNVDRTNDDPIVIAGGPCAFNPLPMQDFIDVFTVGDGEDAIVEICQILEQTKGLPREERIRKLCENPKNGRWSKLTGGTVDKRIAQLKTETALTTYPIPFSSSIQDRAVTEIRRGCGRMCRFCQPGHVTLPIREREAQDIIKITKELVKNTGYDEYSLLSLSSNDYANINEVIKELGVEYDDEKISASLPSQRIDGFNLELANLVQSVRKSTMTLAPEAGSQRLRDVIKKNITKDRIEKAVLTLYENGWSRVKLYFICGLPTETLEDMEELGRLLSGLRYKSKLLKKEKGLKHSLDLTCTLSIFVPKPFTPFQWCPQMSLTEVKAHIDYLMERLHRVKGVKVNYSDKYLSLLECVLTRGDERMGKYIEALYKKGSYLDSWGENFDRQMWFDTASELGLDLEELAHTQYDLDKPLPWDFVNVGLKKEWLQDEYKKAFAVDENSPHIVPTCQNKCVNCGVCPEFKVHKIMAKPYTASDKAQEIAKQCHRHVEHMDQKDIKEVYKYRIKLTKTGILKYFSHLDWQNTFIKALRRTNLKLAYSYGYNPTMKISMGIALPLFCESSCELIDLSLWENRDADYVKSEIEKVMPNGSEIIYVKQIDKSSPAIEEEVYWAEYEIKISDGTLYDFGKFMYNTLRVLNSDEILIGKKTKKGLEKTIDYKHSIGEYRFESGRLFIVLRAGRNTNIPTLRADMLMEHIAPDVIFDIKRTKFLTENLHEL